MTKIEPRCTAGITETFISAEGYLYPCCWIANQPHLDSLREMLGDRYGTLELNGRRIAEVVDDKGFKAIEASWEDGSFYPCVKFCGKAIDEDSRNKPDKHFRFQTK